MASSKKTAAPTGLLTQLYVSTVVCVSLLAIGGQVLTQHALERQALDATVINIAGRQRMLSQKIAKLSTLAHLAQAQAQGVDVTRTGWTQTRAELRSALTLFTSSHEGLKAGDASMALTGNNSATVDAMFDELEPTYVQMVSAAEKLLDPVLDPSRRSIEDAAESIARTEVGFLEEMNAIEGQYEKEATQRVQR